MHITRSRPNAPRVAVVGGGASGVAVATHLAGSFAADVDLRVDLYEPGGTLGRGIAYSTTDDQHLLNVPAKGMSLYRADMDHFRRWAGAGPDEFVSRARYGEYLQSALRAAWRMRAGRARHVRLEVVDMARSDDGGWVLVDGAGATHTADVVVLATGHQSPTAPAGLPMEVVADPRFHTGPWSRQALSGLRAGEHVLCIGTGLTFVDVALSALAINPAVFVTGLSRRGRLPARHLTPLTQPAPAMPLPATGRIALDDVLAHVLTAPDWRAAIDGMRGQTPQIWQRLSDADRDRYMREVSREWDVARHRMAPQIAGAVAGHRKSGRLDVMAAPTYSIGTAGGRFCVQAGARAVMVDRIIVCTGPRADVRLTRLGANLVRRGHARPGPYDIGYDVDPQTGELAHGLFAVGPLRRGVLFESTAMPEISAQAQQLAELIAARSAVAAAT